MREATPQSLTFCATSTRRRFSVPEREICCETALAVQDPGYANLVNAYRLLSAVAVVMTPLPPSRSAAAHEVATNTSASWGGLAYSDGARKRRSWPSAESGLRNHFDPMWVMSVS
jgi:hypothetical protein